MLFSKTSGFWLTTVGYVSSSESAVESRKHYYAASIADIRRIFFSSQNIVVFYGGMIALHKYFLSGKKCQTYVISRVCLSF